MRNQTNLFHHCHCSKKGALIRFNPNVTFAFNHPFALYNSGDVSGASMWLRLSFPGPFVCNQHASPETTRCVP